MKVELQLHSPNDLWPRCFYNAERRCGERDPENPRGGWHVADMCDCPSCPLRVALSSALTQYKAKA